MRPSVITTAALILLKNDPPAPGGFLSLLSKQLVIREQPMLLLAQ
jgi:hypothetical protein